MLSRKSKDSIEPLVPVLTRALLAAIITYYVQLWNFDYIRLPLYEVKQHISRGRGRPKKQYHALERLTRQHADISTFQWGTTCSYISRGCQTADRQSWQSKKKLTFFELRFSRFYVVIAEARVQYPAGADFEGLQLCSPLTHKEV